jgi:hypothetical protein
MKKRDGIRFGTLAVLVALWSVVGASPARADVVVYTTTFNNEFGTLDLTNGTFNQIATLNLTIPGDQIYGLGWGSNGMLYGLDSQPAANIWQIDPTTGAVTEIGAIAGGGANGQSVAGASSDADGKFYVLSQDVQAAYYTLTPPSTTPNMINGATSINTAGGLVAVNSKGTQLFASGFNPPNSTWDLYSVNTATGTATDLGNTGYTPTAGILVGGILYGFDSTSNSIITINTTTGAGSLVALTNFAPGDYVTAMASVPEPSSLVLGVAAAVLAGSTALVRRRR